MIFTSNYAKNLDLYLTFVSGANKDKVRELDKNQNILFFNPDYILDAFHILMAVNKGFYNIKYGKTKSKEYKKEIIHCATNESKLSDSLSLHDIEKNNENNYFIVFIDKKQNEIKNYIDELEGMEINVENYAKFFNYDSLIKHFQIKENEEINGIENGLQRAVYNRVSTKELK